MRKIIFALIISCVASSMPSLSSAAQHISDVEKYSVKEGFEMCGLGSFTGNSLFDVHDTASETATIVEHDGSKALCFSGANFIQLRMGPKLGNNLLVRFDVTVNSGAIQILLTNLSTTLIITRVTPEAISYMGTNVKSDYIAGTPVSVCAYFQSKGNKVTIYVDGVEKYKGNYSSGVETLAGAQLRLQAQGNEVSQYVDNVQVVEDAYLNDGLLFSDTQLNMLHDHHAYPVPDLRDGEFTVQENVYNMRDGDVEVQMIAAIYNKNILQDVWLKEYSLGIGEERAIDVSGIVESIDANSKMKLFIWDKNEQKPYLPWQGFEKLEYSYPLSVEILKDLSKNNTMGMHPKIIIKGDDLNRLREFCNSDQVGISWYSTVKKKALEAKQASLPLRDVALTQADMRKYNLNLKNMAFVYLIDRDDSYAQRVEELLVELMAQNNWKGDYLGLVELCSGVGIAYDWCYNYLSKTEGICELIEDGLAEKALKVGLDNYENLRPSFGFIRDISNQNIVTNSGLGIGALAIADVERHSMLAGKVLEHSLKSLDYSLRAYAPDGGWFESVGYWDYTLNYLVPFMASLDSAAGTTYDVAEVKGLDRTGFYGIHMTGTNVCFNTGDAGEFVTSVPNWFYLAKKYNQPILGGKRYSQLVSNSRAASVEDIIWYDENYVDHQWYDTIAKDAYYRDIETAAFRNSYTENVYYCAIQGGANGRYHGQLDKGSFVYEANGVRWAIDPGYESYSLKNYWTYTDSEFSRWNYYRSRAEGHNTIVINPSYYADQSVSAKAEIKKFVSREEEGFAIMDMTDIYAQNAQSAKRGIRLNKQNGRLLVQDEIILSSESQIYWFMHTKAEEIKIASDGKSAILKQDGKLVKAICLGEGNFIQMAASPLPSSPIPDIWNSIMQNTNAGIRKLAIHLPNAEDTVQISVAIIPIDSENQEITVQGPISLSLWQ